MGWDAVISGISAVVTAGATVAVAVFTGSLSHVTEKLRDAGERQLRIATTAANAASDSAKAVVENERPWVGLYTISLNPKLSVGNNIAAVVVINNSGRTPARKMRAIFSGHILDEGTLPSKPDNSHAPPRALFPNIRDQHRPFENRPPLSQTEYDGLKNGTKVAWIVGRVDYLTIGDQRGWTDVCACWRSASGEFEAHDHGNDAE